MKINKIVYTLLLSGLCSMVVATGAFGQNSSAESTTSGNERTDSIENHYAAEELRSQTLKEDEQNLSDLKSERSKTRAKAKEAREVEREAHEASRESNAAYRSEKKAQKARKQADKQAKKASRARNISNAN